VVSVYKRKGSPYYQAKIYVGGRPRRISTQETVKSRALAFAQLREKEENQRLEGSGTITLLEAGGLYLAETDLKPRTKEVYEGSLRNVYQTLGDFPLGTLTTEKVEHYITQRLRYYRELNTCRAEEVRRKNEEIDRRVAKGELKANVRRPVFREMDGKTQIGHDLRVLSAIFNFAKSKDASLKGRENPVAGVSGRKRFKPRERKGFLTEQQVVSLFNACRQDYQRLFLQLCLDTGMRKSEALGLRWDEIDFNEGKITVGNRGGRGTKNGDAKVIPLTSRMLDTLKYTFEAQNGSSQYVFPSPKPNRQGVYSDRPISTPKTFWKRLLRDAGIEGVCVHDLRHTFASWAIQSGVDISLVQPIMGHRHISTTRKYAKHTESALQMAMRIYEEGTLRNTRSTQNSTQNPQTQKI